VAENLSYYKAKKIDWRWSLRQTLNQHEFFRKSGDYWSLDPNYEALFKEGSYMKTEGVTEVTDKTAVMFVTIVTAVTTVTSVTLATCVTFVTTFRNQV